MDVRMSDGVIVRFPEGTPNSEIKRLTKKYENNLKNKYNKEKELDDESIGIGESIIQFGKDKVGHIYIHVHVYIYLYNNYIVF